jgi:hypothetical protein
VSDRPVSLWVYNKGDDKKALFNDMYTAITMIQGSGCQNVHLLLINKSGLKVTQHSILGNDMPAEVKTQMVEPSRIIGKHVVNSSKYTTHDKHGYTIFSPKKFLNRLSKLYKTDFELFLQHFYFHYTCEERLDSIMTQGLISSAEPTIDIDDIDGGCKSHTKKQKSHKRKRKRKQTRKKKQTICKRKRKQTRKKKILKGSM